MLIQGPAPDLKCKLIISSFLTLPNSLDCLTFTRSTMSIVLLLQMMGRWNRWGLVDLYFGLGGETGCGYHLRALVFSLCFCILLSHVHIAFT